MFSILWATRLDEVITFLLIFWALLVKYEDKILRLMKKAEEAGKRRRLKRSGQGNPEVLRTDVCGRDVHHPWTYCGRFSAATVSKSTGRMDVLACGSWNGIASLCLR